MPPIRNQVTSGNLIQIATMLIALSVGWAAMDARSQTALTGLSDHEQRIRVLESIVMDRLGRIDERLIQIERQTK